MKRSIVITDNSAWLIETDDDFLGGYVVDRATYGSPYIEDGRRFAGRLLVGDNGLDLSVGHRLVFRNTFPNPDGEPDRIVTSGAIVRVVAFNDVPKDTSMHEEDGVQYITIVPSWHWLLPFIDGGFEVRAEARRCFDNADLLVALLNMGRIDQADLQAARSYIAQP